MDAGFITAQTQSLQENAERLGIVWKRRPATVVAPMSDDPTGVTVIMDGDSVAINAYSLIGVPPVGSRIMCDIVPPSGLYVIGYIGNPPESILGGKLFTFFEVKLSGIVAEAVVPDYDITVTELPNKVTRVFCNFRAQTTVNGDTGLFRLRRDNILGSTVALNTFTFASSSPGYTMEMEIHMPSTEGEQTYVLTAQRLLGSGSIAVYVDPSAAFLVYDEGNLSRVTMM